MKCYADGHGNVSEASDAQIAQNHIILDAAHGQQPGWANTQQ